METTKKINMTEKLKQLNNQIKSMSPEEQQKIFNKQIELMADEINFKHNCPINFVGLIGTVPNFCSQNFENAQCKDNQLDCIAYYFLLQALETNK